MIPKIINYRYAGFRDPIQKITGDAYQALYGLSGKEDWGNGSHTEVKVKAVERREKILSLLRRRGSMSFRELQEACPEFGELLLSDLWFLERKGVIIENRWRWRINEAVDKKVVFVRRRMAIVGFIKKHAGLHPRKLGKMIRRAIDITPDALYKDLLILMREGEIVKINGCYYPTGFKKEPKTEHIVDVSA